MYCEPQYTGLSMTGAQTKDTTLTIRVTLEIKAMAVKRAKAERRSIANYIAILIEQDAAHAKGK
jgi:hypothetical protein